MKNTMPDYLDDLIGASLKKYQNASLLFHRVLGLDEDTNKLKPWTYIEDIQNAIQKAKVNFNLAKEQEDILKKDSSILLSRKQEMTLNERMAVGLGLQSVSEVSMTLHHIVGIPYIPAQAIKGLTRSFIIQELFDGDEKEAEKSTVFQYIFGTSTDITGDGEKGKIIFYDAYPCSKNINLRLDVITSHHQKYYNGEALNDSEKTNPINFLTVENAQFRFLLGLKKMTLKLESKLDFEHDVITKDIMKQLNFESGKSRLIEVSLFWMKKALCFGGVGAKSAVGYGYFECEED